jgi:hypothetical protein
MDREAADVAEFEKLPQIINNERGFWLCRDRTRSPLDKTVTVKQP